MAYVMDVENRLGKMLQFTRVSGEMVVLMDTVSYVMQTETSMKVNG